jgi:hypothetical protein
MPFLSNSPEYINSVSREISPVVHALKLISKHKSCIFLCIDEVNKVYDMNPAALKELFNTVGGLSVSFKTFLVPILAGTVIGPIHKVVTQSTHPPLQIPLRLLSLESSKELVAKESKLPVVGHLLQLVADIGGHCRALELLCEALATVSNPKSDKDWAVVFEQVRQRVGGRYELQLLPLSGALAYSFLSKDIGCREFKCPGSDTLSFLDLEEKGLVKLDGPSIGPFLVQVPYIFVCIYLNARHDEPVAKFWEELLMGDNFWWQDWEVFCRNYVAFRLSLYSHLLLESVSLKSFFKGALFNLPTDYKVSVPSFELIGVDDMEKHYPMSKDRVKSNVCMMNAANAPFDAFMFVKTAERQRLLLIFQMKFSNLVTKSPEKVGQEMLTLEYKKVKAAMDEFLPQTKFVVVFLTHREKRQDFKEEQIPLGCILVTKDEEKELFGELYYNRLTLV